jgi:hypothetical protein
MWDIKKWHNRIFCIHCNWNKRASHGSMFHSACGLTGCCPGCGAAIEEWRMTPIWRKPFIMKTVRWVPDLKKRKWFPGFKELSTGYWEERKSDVS